MLFCERHGVTIVDNNQKANIDWITDVMVKLLCVAATGLLGVAVQSLNSMNTEIKELSNHVFELSSHTKVVNLSLDTLKEKIKKLENDVEILKDRTK